MKKSIFGLCGLFVAFSNYLSAQQGFNAAGAGAAVASGSVAFTVGQVDYMNTGGPSGAVYLGVQQPYEIFTIGLDHNTPYPFDISAYPNPVTSHIILTVEGAGGEKLNFQLYDLYGRLLLEQEISQKETHIPMQNFQPATYLLRVAGETEIRLFRLVKSR
jgi:hypothetical protein